jgi:heme/copper-type cytochrome/quinol oxidase subunit 3
MKTFYSSLRLVFSGDTVLLVISALLFLASLANATEWRALRHCRFCGILTTLFSLTFALLSIHELQKLEQRPLRAIMAAALFVVAAVLCFCGAHGVHLMTLPPN